MDDRLLDLHTVRIEYAFKLLRRSIENARQDGVMVTVQIDEPDIGKKVPIRDHDLSIKASIFANRDIEA